MPVRAMASAGAMAVLGVQEATGSVEGEGGGVIPSPLAGEGWTSRRERTKCQIDY